MKTFCAFTCLLCLATLNGTVANAGASVADVTNHPVSKVIKMLEGLKAKSIAEGQQEADAYNKFTYWCKTSIDELKDAIAEEKEKISELEDLLSGKNKEKETLEEQIGTLEQQIADLQASGAKADKNRKGEAALYKKTIADIDGTITAVEGALKALSGAEAETEPGMLLAQKHVRNVLALVSVDSSVMSQRYLAESVSALRYFADPEDNKERPKQLAEGDLDAHVDKYNFKSGSVIELLKGLKHKFEDDKMDATKAETNALNSYDVAKEARDNAIKAAEKSKKEKATTLGEVKDTIKQAESDLESEEADLKADSKGLADTHEACATKTTEWEERSKVRENEILAMDMAMKILAKATGTRTEAPSNPIPPPSPVSFLQTLSFSSPQKMSAVALLRKAAQTTHSRALERLAVEVTAHLSGPFDAVNNMMEKMIFRLMDEQKQEDEHKNWCDQELEKTNTMKDEKESKIEDLNAEIKVQTAAVQKLTEEIKAATEMIADIVSFKKEATEIRKVGKQENKLAIDDSEAAQKALANAIAVLTDFYKSSGEIKKEPWEFVQEPVKLPKNPATWDSPYTSVADPSAQPNGIISVLEATMSDFARMEAETKSQEAQDQKEFDQSMSDNDIEMARRTQESDMKSAEKKRRAGKIADLTASKKNTAAELEKTNQYLEDLEKPCVAGDSSYDDRKAARAKEIEAVQKAQVILQDAFKEGAQKAPEFLEVRRHKN